VIPYCESRSQYVHNHVIIIVLLAFYFNKLLFYRYATFLKNRYTLNKLLTIYIILIF